MTKTPQPDPGTTYEAVVASNVRARMAAAGVTVDAIADALGLSVEAVYRRTRQQVPWSLAELGRVAPVFGVEPHDLARPLSL